MKIKIHFIHALLLICTASLSLYATNIPENYSIIECTITPLSKKEDTNSHPHIPGPPSRAPQPQVTSQNWSGYAAEKNFSSPVNDSVTHVEGSWIVPTLTNTGQDAYSSFWVGIDGFSSPTVEQLGTECDMISGSQQNYAWFEMFPAGAFQINGFPVNPGEVISASVTYIGNSVFVLSILNDTQKVAYTVPTSFTMSSTALRSSAEWIAEAPFSGSILPLADFGTGYFWGCIATINCVTSVFNNNAWQCVPIQMVTNTNIPKATPSAPLPDNGSFFVVWEHS